MAEWPRSDVNAPNTPQKPFQVEAPQISLPKGGGAIRGIGEKFSANPVTGTGALSVPVFASPGRSGFGPQLSLSYDSGSGNSPFGFGWSLALPSITRKTYKGLPRYRDAEQSDTFILSGAEDLVPVLLENAVNWVRDVTPPRTVYGQKCTNHYYRPRVEGLFARIERCVNQSDPRDILWRSISKDNITTWYGKDAASRIADPSDPTRIFSWLICESYDDKGNVISYQYKPEDSTGVDLSQANEHNRSDLDVFVIGHKGGDLAARVLSVKRLLVGVLHPMDVFVFTPQEFEEGARVVESFAWVIVQQTRLLHWTDEATRPIPSLAVKGAQWLTENSVPNS